MKLTADTRPAEVEILKPFAPYLMYKCVPVDKPAVEMSFAEMHAEQPTWDVDSMVRGMQRLCDVAAVRRVMYDVYTPQQCEDDPEKQDIKLFFMPAEQQPSDKPFILLVAGGAYTCVCSIVEAFPTAARFNQLGYNTFILNYRVMQDKLQPKPQQDMAAAVSYILANKDEFGLHNTEYIVNGFSAGASVTTIWGTEANGWGRYGVQRPKALFAIYPAISSEYLHEESKDFFFTVQFGKGYSMETVRAYDIPATMTDNYPPCYIAHSKDDTTVPCKNSQALKELLDARGIPAALELVETGGHGWGDGSGTPAAGWPDRAAAFVQTL